MVSISEELEAAKAAQAAISALLTAVVVLPSLLIMCGLALGQRPPTATEANLRIRCKQMADKKAHELNAVIRSEILESSGSSKYDATNNRCYIVIYQHIRQKSGYEHEFRQMYDAQADDLLASADIINGKKTGDIFGYKGGLLTDEASYEAAISYIDQMMADPQKQ
jgi:hypothetical protein